MRGIELRAELLERPQGVVSEDVSDDPDLRVVVKRHVDVAVRDEVHGEVVAAGAADGEAERAAAGREQGEERGEDRPRTLLRVAEEAPRPLARPDPARGEIAELGGDRLDPRRHQVQQRAGLGPERRPVEVVVADEGGVLPTARAREADAEDRRMRGARQSLGEPERRERDARLAARRARERVPAPESVVHQAAAGNRSARSARQSWSSRSRSSGSSSEWTRRSMMLSSSPTIASSNVSSQPSPRTHCSAAATRSGPFPRGRGSCACAATSRRSSASSLSISSKRSSTERAMSERYVAARTDQYLISEYMSYCDARSRPPRNESSITKQTPTTTPPRLSTRPPIASTVPPVASTSSWMTTRAPSAIASAFSSSEFSPYSSMYVAETVSGGSFPGRRAGTKPQPVWQAIAAPRMNPRASAPRVRSGFRSFD